MELIDISAYKEKKSTPRRGLLKFRIIGMKLEMWEEFVEKSLKKK